MVRRIVNWGAVIVSLVLLVASGVWLYKEAQWAQWNPSSDTLVAQSTAFTQGAIGLEVFPLKYAAVLEDVSAAAFAPESGRSIWETYGFLGNARANEDDKPFCESNAMQKLPHGFNVSTYLPKSAQKTPLKFVGLSCAACHSGVLHTEDGKKTEIIDGMGNPELDVIAFTDAVRNAILDPDLSSKGIVEAYKQRCGTDESGFIDRYIDRVLIWAWLRAAKTQVGKDISQEGLPYHGAQLKQAEFIPPGPSRTRPFRSIVRVALELPGEENYAFSKIPAVFEQRIDLRPRSQYDGSIGDPVTRSFIAAYASGASLVSLSKPEMVDNIRNAAGFTEELGISIAVQRFEELFPNNVPDPVQVEAGLLVYQQHCTECHGYRPTDGDRAWVAEGDKLHQFSPIGAPDDMNAIGTDPERVTFRYNDLLALGLTTTLPGRADNLEKQRDSLKAAQKMAREEGQPAVAYFWSRQLERLNLSARQFRLGHPLYFPETTLKDEVAFINNPIPYAYLRAPYLHNGSIPNMRQLINLDPRPPAFCRGNNIYDPDSMGFITATPDSSGACPTGQSFLFDTGVRGNSNAGHDYPWKRDSPNWNEEALLNLLAYLKTL